MYVCMSCKSTVQVCARCRLGKKAATHWPCSSRELGCRQAVPANSDIAFALAEAQPHDEELAQVALL